MRKSVEIENIEAMRFNEGINDVELREEIRSLAVGDFVKLTFLSGSPAKGESLLVQITSIEGAPFVAAYPASLPLLDCQLSELGQSSPSRRPTSTRYRRAWRPMNSDLFLADRAGRMMTKEKRLSWSSAYQAMHPLVDQNVGDNRGVFRSQPAA